LENENLEKVEPFEPDERWWRYEQEEEGRWSKVKKIKCWWFTIDTMDMQLNG